MRSDGILTRLGGRRGIRCDRDRRIFVIKTTGYVAFLAMTAGVMRNLHAGVDQMFAAALVVGIAAGAAAAPIAWEIGTMLLDLWTSTHHLRELATKDQQTGLLNNRSFVAAVEERLAAGRRIALFVGDLDRFKSINDRHGHLVGDEVIARVGETLRDIFHEVGILGRMGGEEYAVMLECPFGDLDVSHTHIGALAEEVRRRIADLRIPVGKDVLCPTISIGIAWGRPDATFADLYARADKALYVAKAAGRDRVVGEHEIECFDPEHVLARRQDLFWRAAPPKAVEEDTPSIAWA